MASLKSKIVAAFQHAAELQTDSGEYVDPTSELLLSDNETTTSEVVIIF